MSETGKEKVIRFFSENYPGTIVEFVDAENPDELYQKLSDEPTPPVEPTDDYWDSPVGWSGNQSGTKIWPDYYIDANPIGNLNDGSHHTGSDLNDNVTSGWDSDRLANVYADCAGKVVTAGRLSGTWGNVVIIEHNHPYFGKVYSRYAHLDSYSVGVGDSVSRGHHFGQIGDSFGQFAYHLHYDVCLTNTLVTNPAHWPGSDLQGVVLNYVEPATWIRMNRPGTTWPEARQAFVSRNVNFRTGPNTSFTSYRLLSSGTELTVLNEIDNWYFIQLSTGEFGFSHKDYISFSEPTPPPVTSEVVAGIHMPADGGDGVGFPEPVISELIAYDANLIKYLSSHSQQLISQTAPLVRDLNTAYFIVRAFLSWGGRNLTAGQFYNDTINDVLRSVNILRTVGVPDHRIIIELHNEMNLYAEGFSFSWNDGGACGRFFNEVHMSYLTQLPNVKYMLGGLSPGGAVPSVRYDSNAFLDEMIATGIFLDMDFNSVHLYTSGDWNNDIWWLDRNLSLVNLPVYITEASYHQVVDGTTYADKLYELVELCRTRSNVEGITWFVMSASDTTFHHECFVHNPDKNGNQYQNVQSRGIGARLYQLDNS